MPRLRPILFQLHWFLGLTAGLVLMLCGVTGALLTFEDEIVAAVSPGIVTVTPREAPRLTPDAILARVEEQAPGRRVALLALAGDPGRAVRLRLAPQPGHGREPEVYADPYDGRLLGPGRGAAAFQTILHLHRWLLIPGEGDGWGRTLTGASLLALVYLTLSGLYLRWPKRAGDWRIWLKPALTRRGRPLYWSLHAVAGTWVLVIYLMVALTGLWWSYGWYRDGVTRLLTGRAPQAETAPKRRPDDSQPAIPLDPAFAAFAAATDGRYAEAVLTPGRGGGPIRIRAVMADAPHFQARDEWRFRPDGTLIAVDRYGERRLGARLAGSILALHEGRFFGWPGTLVAFLAALAMPLFGVTGLLLYLGRRRSRRRAEMAHTGALPQRG
ncbi:PepSY-associated TM helix domain-containing protein [Methylobacterium sp. JK268]